MKVVFLYDSGRVGTSAIEDDEFNREHRPLLGPYPVLTASSYTLARQFCSR